MPATLAVHLRHAAVALAAGTVLAIPAAFAQTTPAATAAAQAAASAPVAAPAQAAAAAPAQASAAALPADLAALKKTLETKLPGAEVKYVAKSAYFGLYEAMVGDQMIYTDRKADQIIVGSIYDVATKTNLTDARARKLNRVDIAKLPMDLAFVRVKGNGARKLIVFSDADCPFCHRLEKEIKGLDNVTIYTFLFPIDQLHPDAANKSKKIWCAPDKVKAWDEFFTSGKVPDNAGDCGDPIEATQALGNSLRINATPTLVFADGTMMPGALPLAQLEREMASADAEAKKIAQAATKR